MTTLAATAPTGSLPEIALQSVVLLRLGERRFAIAATQISELVAPSRLFKFPHQSPRVEGVILRRGRIVPVCEVAERLLGKKLSARRFYLIAVRNYGTHPEWVAIPVTGECELINAEVTDEPNDPPNDDTAAVASDSNDDTHPVNPAKLNGGTSNCAIVDATDVDVV